MTIDPTKTHVLNEPVLVNDIPYQLDVQQASDVELSIREDGKVLWVNVDGICALRISRIDRITIEDARPTMTVVPDSMRET